MLLFFWRLFTPKKYLAKVIQNYFKRLMNPANNMDSSDLTDKDLDYQRTITKARSYTCTLLFLHMAMGISLILVIIFNYDAIIIAPIVIDAIACLVDVWQLNTFHFFRSALFKPLVLITSLLTLLQLGDHIGLYFYVNKGTDLDTHKMEMQVSLFVGAGLAVAAAIISFIKNRFVLVRMVRGREDLNRIKHSLMSQDHFQYALKKSMQTGN